MTSGWWSRTQGHKQYLSWRIKSSRSFFFSLALLLSNCFFWSPHRQLVLSIVTAQQSLMLLIHKVGCLGLFLCNYWICLRKWLCTITLKHQMSFDQTDWNQWMENQMTMNTLGERKYSCYEVMEILQFRMFGQLRKLCHFPSKMSFFSAYWWEESNCCWFENISIFLL